MALFRCPSQSRRKRGGWGRSGCCYSQGGLSLASHPQDALGQSMGRVPGTTGPFRGGVSQVPDKELALGE